MRVNKNLQAIDNEWPGGSFGNSIIASKNLLEAKPSKYLGDQMRPHNPENKLF